MAMTQLRMLEQSLYYKVQELMNTMGYTVGRYTIIAGYPNELEIAQQEILPIITVEVDDLFGRDFELGSKQVATVHFTLDVFSKSRGQRGDIAYTLQSNLNDSSLMLYDFNTGFPTAIGNYTGIATLGSCDVFSVTIANVVPDVQSVIPGDRFHAIVDGLINLN